MREKVTASFLFRNRKESYERSVAHPFQGDYVRLRQNTQWRKIVNESVDHFIVFADIVSKITRSSGRVTTPTLSPAITIFPHPTPPPPFPAHYFIHYSFTHPVGYWLSCNGALDFLTFDLQRISFEIHLNWAIDLVEVSLRCF